MPKVVRHLVDEEGLAFAVYLRVAEILFPEAREVFRGEFGEQARVARSRVGAFVPLQVLHEPRNDWEFHRPLHLGVRGEDLLDESGTRSRQPQDEDGRPVPAPGTLPRGEELPGAYGRLQTSGSLQRLGPVAALGLLQRVAALVKRERFCVLVPVLERLTERET